MCTATYLRELLLTGTSEVPSEGDAVPGFVLEIRRQGERVNFRDILVKYGLRNWTVRQIQLPEEAGRNGDVVHARQGQYLLRRRQAGWQDLRPNISGCVVLLYSSAEREKFVRIGEPVPTSAFE